MWRAREFVCKFYWDDFDDRRTDGQSVGEKVMKIGVRTTGKNLVLATY
jgi:hypothetical protein